MPEVRFLADPDIDCAQVRTDVAPVVRFFLGRVDDLQQADGSAVEFGNEDFAPVRVERQLGRPVADVIITAGRDDMRLRVPVFEQRLVGERRPPQPYALLTVVAQAARPSAAARCASNFLRYRACTISVNTSTAITK